MDDLSSQQLRALGQVTALFEGRGIAHWLFGGWAVDFHAGSVTRRHDDVDVAVWLEDLPSISQLLEAEGWRHSPAPDEDGGTGYERGRVRLELTYLERDGDGRIFTPLRDGRIPWPDEALGDDVRELLGVRTRVVGLGPLALAKSFPRDDPADAAKDRADFRVLSALAR
jgi:hypothetical protein